MTIKHTVRTDRRARGSLSGTSVEYQLGLSCAKSGSSLPVGSSRAFRSGYNKGLTENEQFITSLDKARKTQLHVLRKRAIEFIGVDTLRNMDREQQKTIINHVVRTAVQRQH